MTRRRPRVRKRDAGENLLRHVDHHIDSAGVEGKSKIGRGDHQGVVCDGNYFPDSPSKPEIELESPKNIIKSRS
jgi:hypothetical protein